MSTYLVNFRRQTAKKWDWSLDRDTMHSNYVGKVSPRHCYDLWSKAVTA